MKKTLQIEGFDTLFDKDDLLFSIEGQEILEKVRNQKLLFTCTCMGENGPLRMYVRRITRGRKYHYVIVRADGTKDKHDPDCMNYSTVEDNKKREDDDSREKEKEKEKENEEVNLFDDEIYVNRKVTSTIKNGLLEPLVFITDNHLEKYLELPDTRDEQIENQARRSYRYTEMFSMGENILFYAWHNFVKKNGENPNIEKLFKNIYEEPNKHRIGKDDFIELNSIMFKPYGKLRYGDINETIKKAFTKIYHQNNEHYNMYILAKVIDYKEDENIDNLTILTIEEPQKKNYFNLTIETNRFKNKFRKRPTDSDKLISCFTKIGDGDYLEVTDFAFIPVAPKLGVSVDSNYEVEFANHLAKNKILFVKPPKSSNPYRSIFGKSNNPDFILLEKDTREEATIVEVFGYDKKQIEDVEFIKEYWEKANKKIDYYKSLETFNFFYWLPYKNPLPRVYQPRKPRRKEVI